MVPSRGRPATRTPFARLEPCPYGNAELTDQGGVFGTPDDVGEQLEALAAAGANHLLLIPVTRYEEQVEALAAITGLADRSTFETDERPRWRR